MTRFYYETANETANETADDKRGADCHSAER